MVQWAIAEHTSILLFRDRLDSAWDVSPLRKALFHRLWLDFDGGTRLFYTFPNIYAGMFEDTLQRRGDLVFDVMLDIQVKLRTFGYNRVKNFPVQGMLVRAIQEAPGPLHNFL
uniref:Uncharacterized protein n=1 Tax=Paramoeba aestuarina TaxID=180227 RepID=A0A7S4KZS3_9EUKA|mmetsp:Transcript_28913/g.44723  ORF Transcript_28913/g.44723 Transcript_28913/m.44723 type:complete len:113 (+) Transcript_28913:111-449(+)